MVSVLSDILRASDVLRDQRAEIHVRLHEVYKLISLSLGNPWRNFA
jgi:hypothetical protein